MLKNHIKQISRPTLREQVYQALKKAIVTLELEPGQRLNDVELASQFGVSRTPVREALKRLEDDRLVESIPGSITRVKPLDEEEAKHAFTVVAALHSLATRLAVPKLTQHHIDQLEQINQSLHQALQEADIIKAINEDNHFHYQFLEMAENPEINLALDRITSKIYRLELAKFGSTEGLHSVQEHEEILIACKKGDAQKAAYLVEQNWLSLGKLLIK
ncbi:GntR family transcriptional regulator [Thermoflavimicrobium daqui]|uniref:GntR family transcriptional regulator n=1 Tax=Thermoflavimicrobium daqui TaxID=2137476 RepID=A0A364K8G2_9BACL|nr:GntR family transcriptional regulator [Thermoflavimicrobium daqui]RAL26490.1 GntR family transcriptional regulator [Thermoflavimicrobium daqui]